MSYKNPVISIQGTDHGDPAVVKYLGVYYLYHTGLRQISVYQSFNLIDWEKCGTALHASDDSNHWAQIELWAPEVIYENGKFYMYVTGARRKEDGSADDEIRRIGVATSDSPTGPFQLSAEPLTDEWSIDAHPFKDEDGSYYMFYNVRNEYTKGPGNVIGTGNVVDRMVDLETLGGNPSMVVKPEHHWEGNKEGTFFWNEGPFVLKKDGTYFQMYSAGFFGDDTYGVYYATASKPMGDEGYHDSSWEKWQGGTPILKTNEACLGPGHHVVVKGPNGIDDYIVYHGYEPDKSVIGRKVRVGRFKWVDNHIWLEPPSTKALPLPDAPAFDGRTVESVDELNKQLYSHMYDNYFFETNVKLGEKNDPIFSGYAYYVDEKNYAAWYIDTIVREISVSVYEDGIEKLGAVHSLADSIDFKHYQLLQVSKKGKEIKLFVNHILAVTIVEENLKGTGRVRLSGEASGISVKGTILTELKK